MTCEWRGVVLQREMRRLLPDEGRDSSQEEETGSLEGSQIDECSNVFWVPLWKILDPSGGAYTGKTNFNEPHTTSSRQVHHL